MIIEQITSPLLDSNMYVITEGGHAILIDPFETTIKTVDCVDYILLTHEHYDHISGVNYWKEKTGATVICHEQCAENISNPKRNLSRYFGTFCEMQTWVEVTGTVENKDYICYTDIACDDGYYIEWMGHKIEIFHLPGHSSGSSGIVVDSVHFFSGDSLIPGFEVDFFPPTGSKKLFAEITKPFIEMLPEDTIVYPGHFDVLNFEEML